MRQTQAIGKAVFVHLASGVGNIILATPLLLALSRHGYVIDLMVDSDYRGTAELFQGWSALRNLYDGAAGEEPHQVCDIQIPAIPPFYWSRYAAHYRTVSGAIGRPPDSLFFRNEQAYYLEFARQLGCAVSPPPACFLPISPDRTRGVTSATLVLAPGCKTGVMAAKRWPYFAELAEHFDDVTIVGVEDDLCRFGGGPMRFPAHVRSLVGKLSLRETASVLAAAGAVVANDSGLGHVAAAVGAPTVLLFGPTPHEVLGGFAPREPCIRARDLSPFDSGGPTCPAIPLKNMVTTLVD